MAPSLIWFLAFLPLPRCARLRMIHIILLRPLSLKKRSTAMTLCFTVTTDFQRPPLLGTHGIGEGFADGAGPRFENIQSATKQPGFNTYTVRPLPGGGRKVTCPADTFMTRLGPNVVEFKVKKRRSARRQSRGSESALLGHPNNHTSPPSR
jgi:hypothetical protein